MLRYSRGLEESCEKCRETLHILEQFGHLAGEAGEHVFAGELIVSAKPRRLPRLPPDVDRLIHGINNPNEANACTQIFAPLRFDFFGAVVWRNDLNGEIWKNTDVAERGSLIGQAAPGDKGAV